MTLFERKVQELIDNVRVYEAIGTTIRSYTYGGARSIANRILACEKKDEELGKWFTDNGYTADDVNEYVNGNSIGNS